MLLFHGNAPKPLADRIDVEEANFLKLNKTVVPSPARREALRLQDATQERRDVLAQMLVKDHVLNHRKKERDAFLKEMNFFEIDQAELDTVFAAWSKLYDAKDLVDAEAARAAFDAIPAHDEKLKLAQLNKEIKILSDEIAAFREKLFLDRAA
ncbi:MAG: hypothetical protein A3C15_01020 [Candidatus Magasanikbacteria bacterium RIFCSPHIGHO2_02_FULL_50_9b]|uniref:Uncharacterized protein n=1 Tax=Candidatus Magasanikbacteria bacterium RIFCSPHIGHO2_02_FULL_50_9b TaxID=1798682 RepID=A0A1F6M9D4_9BACT|nr:MAG: hypothetical protein A3C15_01020 [Candidatus Magasanikbacteria bacterium RIFCSPHIGHO2_02_FULL_50_9b]